MSNELNYPYLLAVHTLCVDGQLHQNELQFLRSISCNTGVDPATEAAAELIITQADEYLGMESVLQCITPEQRTQALSLAALAAHFDGSVDRTEQRLLERLKLQWAISDSAYTQILSQAQREAQRLIADLKPAGRDEMSTGAKVLNGLEAVLGQRVVNRIIGTLGTTSMKERLQEYRIEALLSGPKYDKAIAECRDVGLRDIEVADSCLLVTAQALKQVAAELNGKITEIEAQIGDTPAQAAREALRLMKGDRDEIERLISQELQEL